MVENGKKYQKSVFFRRQNSQKSEKNLAKASKNCRKIRSKTFLKGGADRAGVILKGRAAGSSGPPIFRGGWAVAAVIGAALSSLKVVAGCCRFAAGGWCRAGSVAAGRRLSILYGVGCHWWRWASLSILYSSKVGRASVLRQAQNAQKAGRAVWPVLPFVFVRSGFIRCRRGHLLRAAGSRRASFVLLWLSKYILLRFPLHLWRRCSSFLLSLLGF